MQNNFAFFAVRNLFTVYCLPMTTILVVDDDPAILSGITILLEQAGYHVLQASNGADARRLLANKPDLVILDIMLPDDDGIELCRVIRQQTHDTPVLMNQYITIKHQH